MANSSDEEFNSDNDSIDLNLLWRDSPFQSDPPTEEDKAETNPDPENPVGPPCVLELTPISGSASALDNNINTAETSTSAGMEARQGFPELDVSLTPPGTPWIPAASSSFYGEQAMPIPVLNVAPRRRYRRRVPDHFLVVDIPALSKDSDDEVEVKAPKKDPRFVLPGAIREREEREEREDAEIDEATRSSRILRSKFVSELLMSSMTNRISRADFEKLSGVFGTKYKKK